MTYCENQIRIESTEKTNFFDNLKANEAILSQTDDIAVHGVLAENCLRNSLGATSDKIEKLEQFGTVKGAPFLVVKNLLDLTGIPPTPTDDKVPDIEDWYHVVASMIGVLTTAGMQAGSLLNEKAGRLCHMVAPAKADQESMLRTTKPLNYHTEIVNGIMTQEGRINNACPVSPDVIILGCLRNPHKVGTTVLPIEVLLNSLSYNTVLKLQNPEFTALSQSSVEVFSEIKNVPILVPINGGKFAMRYSRSKIKPETVGAAQALNALTEFLDNEPFGLTTDLEPSDVLLINNRTCLHRRVAIKNTSKFDGTDRWLVRIYGFSQESWRQTTRLSDRRHVISSDADRRTAA